MLYLIDIKDNPIRPATEEEIALSDTSESGIFLIDGVEYYVDRYDEELIDDCIEEMRREMAREAGMLGGCAAYNDFMGY